MELWTEIGFDHIWQSVGHLESDDLDIKRFRLVIQSAILNRTTLKEVSALYFEVPTH